jgi:hypothetical protein
LDAVVRKPQDSRECILQKGLHPTFDEATHELRHFGKILILVV